MRRLGLALFLALVPGTAVAQASDRDTFTAFLEDNLSGAGRTVTVTGFRGALSSQAQMDTLTIADGEGVWITLTDVVLDWNRTALLLGRVDVNELSAREITVERAPKPAEGVIPSPEARGFSLPELPVSLQIDKLAVETLILKAPLLGQEVTGTLAASADLADGAGDADLLLTRTGEGPSGEFDLAVSYSNATGALSVKLDANEGQGGLISRGIGLPGEPAIALVVGGTGTFDDFLADIALRSDGQDRLAGKVTLAGTETGRSFNADLAGNPTPLFLPEYAAFFGPDVAIHVEGEQKAAGVFDLSRLSVQARALTLDGSALIASDGLPQRLVLAGRLGLPDGAPVLLPIAGDIETRVENADLNISFDASLGEGWSGRVVATGLERSDLRLRRMEMNGSGRITRRAGVPGGPVLGGVFDYNAVGVIPADKGLDAALGRNLLGTLTLDWQPGGSGLRIGEFYLDGEGYEARINGRIGDLASGFRLTGNLEAQHDDLSKLSTLAGRSLGGSVSLTGKGDGSPLGGDFDIKTDVAGSNILTGIPEADRALQGQSTIRLSARRDAAGTTIREFRVQADQLTAEASGLIARLGSDVTAEVDLRNLAVLGPQYGGLVNVTAQVVGTDIAGTLRMNGTARDVRIGRAEVDRAMAGQSDLSVALTYSEGRLLVDRATVGNAQVQANVTGFYSAQVSNLTAAAKVPDMGAILAGYGGALDAVGSFTGNLEAGRVTLDGTGRDLALAQAQADRALAGDTELGVAVNFAQGRYQVERAELKGKVATASVTGIYDPAGSDLNAVASIPELARILDGYGGALNASARLVGGVEAGRLTVDGTGRDLRFNQAQADRALAGDTVLGVDVAFDKGRFTFDRAEVKGRVIDARAAGFYDPAGSNIAASVDVTDLGFLGRGFGGALMADVTAQGTVQDGTGTIKGSARNLAVGQAVANRLLAGTSTIDATVGYRDGLLDIRAARFANPQVTVSATGSASQTVSVDLEARLANLALLVPEFAGPLTVSGRAMQDGAGYDLDLRAQGPGGVDGRVAGRVASDFRSAGLSITGAAQAALANPFIGTRAVSGALRYDLQLDGPLALASLSGPVTLSGGRLADPTLPFSLEGLGGTATLGGGAARLVLTASATSGGRLDVTGTAGLRAPYTADLELAVSSLRLSDPTLYQTQLSGELRLRGPLSGGAAITGDVRVGETELRVPSTGFSGSGAIDGLKHVNEPAAVRATRDKAGLTGGGNQGGVASGPARRPYGLDVTIRAPRRIFLRGRGIDAELGGQLRVTGTTDNVVPIGAIELIRGRIDILGKRLNLTTAQVLLQGDLEPYLEVIATNQSDGISTSIEVRGRASAPEVIFTSSPELPQEEVLSRLLFGRGLENISALQAAQLANAVATLAGRGGQGIIGNLRQGFGFDDLDVATDADGNASIRVGKYLSRNLYSEVEVGQDGKSKINLNLDVRPGVKLRGSVGSDGGTGIGIFIERDY